MGDSSQCIQSQTNPFNTADTQETTQCNTAQRPGRFHTQTDNERKGNSEQNKLTARKLQESNPHHQQTRRNVQRVQNNNRFSRDANW